MNKLEVSYDEVLHNSLPFAITVADGQVSVVAQLTRSELVLIRDEIVEALNAHEYEQERRTP